MAKRKIISAVFLCLIVGVFCFFFFRQDSEEETYEEPARLVVRSDRDVSEVDANADELSLPQRIDQKLKKVEVLVPIDFWGEVRDSSGDTIANAEIDVTILNSLDWSESGGSVASFKVNSDAEGRFEILNQRGAHIRLSAKKEGYVPYYAEGSKRDQASAEIWYGGEDDNLQHKRPSKQNPTVLVLRKKKPAANIEYVSQEKIPLFKKGQITAVALDGKNVKINLEVRCWSSCPEPFNYDKYDWRAEIRAVGGQLQPIKEQDPVTAPTQGYLPFFQINMPKDTQENWLRSSPGGANKFWVKFDDGAYAKARIEVSTGRKHEVDAEVWYNLDGANNFEQ